MIRPIVSIKSGAGLTTADSVSPFAALRQLQCNVPGPISMTSACNESLEQVKRGYRHVFVANFNNRNGMQANQVQPDHPRLGCKQNASAVGGKEGDLCFDLPVSD